MYVVVARCRVLQGKARSPTDNCEGKPDVASHDTQVQDSTMYVITTLELSYIQ